MPPLITGPFGDFIRNNATGISAFGSGLASGGLPGAAKSLDAALPGVQANNEKKSQASATKAWLLGKGYTDLAQAIDAGEAPTDVVSQALARSTPKFEQVGDNLLKIQGDQISTAWTAPPKGPDVPTNYQLRTDGTPGVEPIPGGPADDSGDAKAIADAIARGEQPPVTTGLYHLAAPVRANLAKQGYDLTKATQDYNATTRLLSSMNGPQQLRLRQAVTFTKESLPVIEQLAGEWKAGGFPALNKVQLEAAKQGLLGQKAQSLATRLATQINDMTAELGTVYKGGNSSTDESLKLAASNLDANWSEQTLLDSVKMIKQNIVYRENSMNSVTTAGIPNSTYNPMVPQAGTPTTGAPAPTAATGDPDLDRALQQYGQ